MSETFYEVLSVPPDAATETIETAFREAVKETHPDVSDDPAAEDRFKQVQRARAVLADPDERARYDRLGHDRYVAREYGDGDADTGTGRTAAEATGATDTADESGDGRDRAKAAGETGGTTTEAAHASASSGAARGGSSAAGGHSAATGAGVAGATGWNQSRSATRSGYATRESDRVGLFDRPRVPLTPKALGLVAVTAVCYPLFLWAILFPPFPLVVNLVVAACTLGTVAYLMSVPDVAIVVFGLWSVLVPAALLAVDGLSLASVGGALTLVAVWFPLGLAVLTRAALRQ